MNNLLDSSGFSAALGQIETVALKERITNPPSTDCKQGMTNIEAAYSIIYIYTQRHYYLPIANGIDGVIFHILVNPRERCACMRKDSSRSV